MGCAPFNFLRFEFRWGKDRAGKPHVNKRTVRKSLKNSLKRVKLWCQENRHRHLPDLFKLLNTRLTGYFHHFAVHGNYPSLALFYHRVIRYLWKYLNQRSQRKSYNWEGFKQLLAHFGVVKPYVAYRPRHVRRASVPVLA